MRSRKHRIVGAALAASAMLVVAGCGGSDDDGGGGSSLGEPTAGGTLRLETTDLGFTNAFDPTGEYLGLAHGYYSGLLTRGLVGYKHVDGAAGNELIPDLAEGDATVSDDGLTYTFKIKKGVKFSPPVNREVTSKDVAYAFERIGTKSLAAQYAFYYDVIDGMAAFKDGKAKTISGITTPDDSTIQFKLTKKQGDFLYRLAMPAAHAMPKEVAGCFTKPGEYGRYLVSSGPYMIEGADAQGTAGCGSLKPLAGFDGTKKLYFVRNPNYDKATDSAEVRPAYVDKITIDVNTNEKDIFDKIERGELDGTPDTPPSEVIQQYATDDALKPRLQVFSGDRTWYITMNLTQPPFDDVNVRKAVNFAVDKAAIQQDWGGEPAGRVAKNVVPQAMYSGKFPADYDPYPFDVEKAKEAMKASKYDSNKDGVCDAAVCKNVFHISRNVAPWSKYNPVIESSLKAIGIELNTRELPTSAAYTTIQNVSKNVPIASNAGWGKDYADPGTYAVLFQSATIIPTGNSNYALVGITDDQAKELGVKLPGAVPSVDADIAKCDELSGDERTDCWVAFDKKLMEEVVPWVPYLDANSVEVVGPAVTNYQFDQNSTEASFVHMSVDPAKQK